MLNFKQKVLSKYTVVESSDGFSKILDDAKEDKDDKDDDESRQGDDD